jgi:DNA-binding transcriptional LysR family regulator
MDKLKAMSVFVEIAEKGSLTAAANSLGKSLPAVVRMLAALEDNLQVRLFNRTTRRIALTEEGHIYLQRCNKILTEIEESERELGEHQLEPHGSIIMTAPIRFGELHVAPSVTRYLEQYPRVQVHLMLFDRLTNLLNEGIDVAVRISHLEDSSLFAKPVGEIRQVTVASPALLKAIGGAPERPEALSDLPCVRCTSISSSPTWHFNESGKRLDVHIDGAFTCNQIKTTVDACISGLGYGVFFNYQVMPWVKTGELEIVLNDFEPDALPLSLVYPHTRLMAMRVRTLVDWLASDLKPALAELG